MQSQTVGPRWRQHAPPVGQGLATGGREPKSWDLAFHFFRRVDWSHKVTSHSELFRCAEQVRTPVSE